MKRLLLFSVLVVSVVAPATASGAVTWPATCQSMRCVNAHLNQLHKQARANAAATRKLRADVMAMNQAVWDGIYNINNRLGCWDTMPLTRYRGSAWDANAHTPFGFYGVNRDYNADWDGYLDFRHPGQPDTAYVYRVIFNACTSGPVG